MSSLTLYKVSRTNCRILTDEEESDAEFPNEFCPPFQLSLSFARASWGENKSLCEALQPLITSKDEMIGAVLFEKRDEFVLNWYHTNLKKKMPRKEDDRNGLNLPLP